MTKFKFTNEPPTEKQILFARDIAAGLDIELPAERTKAAYSEFISQNIKAYKETCDDAYTSYFSNFE